MKPSTKPKKPRKGGLDPFGYKARTGEPRKSSAKGGRPELLNDEITSELCKVLQIGSTIRSACALAGIAEASFYLWAKKGARDRRKGRETRYARFSEQVKKAAEMACVGFESVVAEAAKGSPALPEIKRGGRIVQHARPAILPNWQAAMTWLERRYPQDYARRTYQIESVGNAPSGPAGVVAPYEVRLPEVDALLPSQPQVIEHAQAAQAEAPVLQEKNPVGATTTERLPGRGKKGPIHD